MVISETNENNCTPWGNKIDQVYFVLSAEQEGQNLTREENITYLGGDSPGLLQICVLKLY